MPQEYRASDAAPGHFKRLEKAGIVRGLNDAEAARLAELLYATGVKAGRWEKQHPGLWEAGAGNLKLET